MINAEQRVSSFNVVNPHSAGRDWAQPQVELAYRGKSTPIVSVELISTFFVDIYAIFYGKAYRFEYTLTVGVDYLLWPVYVEPHILTFSNSIVVIGVPLPHVVDAFP